MKRLSDVIVGKYTVRYVDAGHVALHRLASMGIVPDVELEVTSNNIHLPLVIEVKHSQVTVGRGLASKVLVE